jgi:hypothetical protein
MGYGIKALEFLVRGRPNRPSFFVACVGAGVLTCPNCHPKSGSRPRFICYSMIRSVVLIHTISLGRRGLEGVTSGYWTLFAKQSSDVVSH